MAVEFAGAVQGVQDVPQLDTELFDEQLAPHAWNPELHAKPHAVPLQVAVEFGGAVQGVQDVVPQVEVLVLLTHAMLHTCCPLAHTAMVSVNSSETRSPVTSMLPFDETPYAWTVSMPGVEGVMVKGNDAVQPVPPQLSGPECVRQPAPHERSASDVLFTVPPLVWIATPAAEYVGFDTVTVTLMGTPTGAADGSAPNDTVVVPVPPVMWQFEQFTYELVPVPLAHASPASSTATRGSTTRTEDMSRVVARHGGPPQRCDGGFPGAGFAGRCRRGCRSPDDRVGASERDQPRRASASSSRSWCRPLRRGR